MSVHTLKIFCGIDFNLMESGDANYRAECLEYWLENNCQDTYSYTWDLPDTFEVKFNSEMDKEKALVLIKNGIPRKP